MKTVFSVCGVSDRHNPIEHLRALKSKIPAFKATAFAIPGQCSGDLLDEYASEDWIELGANGYHGSTYECMVWDFNEAKDKLEEIFDDQRFSKVFCPTLWIASEPLYEAVSLLGLTTLDDKFYFAEYPTIDFMQLIHNRRGDLRCSVGFAAEEGWLDRYDGTEDFAFVSEVAKQSNDVSGESHLYAVKDEMGLEPGDTFMDVGAYRGEEIAACAEFGVRCVSYEPHPDYYQRLVEKFGQSDDIINAAVTTHGGNTKLFLVDEGVRNAGPTLDRRKETASGDSVPVDAVDLAKEIRRLGGVKALKLDVEGHEYDVLDHILKDGAVKMVEQVWVEDHARAFKDVAWHSKKANVLMKYEDAGIKIGSWV